LTPGRLQLRLARSEPGDGAANDDVAGAASGAAWVIDGATGLGEPLLPGPSDAAWFAQEVDRALRSALEAEPEAQTPAILRRVVAEVGAAFEEQRLRAPTAAHETPSAAFVMVRALGEAVELSGLGDCQAIYADPSGEPKLFGLSALTQLDTDVVAELAAAFAADPGLLLAEAKTRLLPGLRRNRALMNRPGGYWILSLDPAAIDHLETLVLAPEDGALDCVLASDGFMRLHELFGWSLAELLAVEDEAALDAAFRRLREAEAADGECRARPRFKRSDDASFARVRVEL